MTNARHDVVIPEALALLNSAGRPPTSACRCVTWPCPCACHKYDRLRDGVKKR